MPGAAGRGEAAASTSETVASSSVSVAGVTLTLVDNAGACWLEEGTPNASRRPLDLPAGCTFHRDKTGAVRTLEAHGKTFALVEHSAPSPASPGDCVTRLRGLQVTGGTVRIAPAAARVAACPPFAWDDVMFLGPFEGL